MDLVGDEKPLAAECRRQLGRLATRRGAEVEYTLAGRGGAEGGGEHGTCLLDVVCARLVQRMLAGASLAIRRIVKASFLPRDGAADKGGDLAELFGGDLQGVDPQRGVRGSFVRGEKCREVGTQHGLHAVEEQGGEGGIGFTFHSHDSLSV